MGASNRSLGQLWLAPALGPEFLYHAVSRGVVHIIGKDADGIEGAGSGIVVGPHTILTARHVIQDIRPSCAQDSQGVACTADPRNISKHDVEDVAFITVSQKLSPVPGLVLHPPIVGQKVFALGYAPVPLVASAPLLMHSGEVTNESVTLMTGASAFLYSATVRPGDSGGPVISEDGYLLGITTCDLSRESVKKDWIAPHYAGVDATTICRAGSELRLGIGLPFESRD